MDVREPSAKYLATPAYKQTEVGVIPQDWNAERLGAHATFRTGPFGSALHKSDYVLDGVPIINPMQIIGGKIVPTPSMTISEEAAGKLSDFRVVEDEIVIGRRGEMGRCAVVLPEYRGWLCGTGSMIIRSKSSLDARFAQRVLSSPRMIAAIENTSVGTTMINLNQGTLSNLLIPVPSSLAEQQAIAEALSDADALIESLEQLLAKKRQIKQGAMQELLTGQKRLPGFAGEWQEVALGQWGGCYRGVSYNPSIDLSPFDADNTIRLLRSNNVQSSSVVLADMQYVDASRVSADQRLRANDILICMANGSRDLVGKSARFSANDGFEYTFGAFMGSFRPDAQQANPDFVFYIFQTEDYRKHISILLAGSSINNLTPGSIESFVVSAPTDKAEQTAIATVLSDMDAEIVVLEDKLAKVRNLKPGVMQELLTGRIRLIQRTAEVIPFPAPQADTSRVKTKSHNWQINEAVVISVLAKHFGSEQWPLGRKRYTKLSYLLHRHAERQAEGYLKKAAGPYNPATKYGGPEKIALKNGYVRQHVRDQFSGFVADENIGEAEGYFAEWYGEDMLTWLEQFRRKTNDELELLATVDMAMEELRRSGAPIALSGVKGIIQSNPEWQAKLGRAIFSDANIERTIARCDDLFVDR